MTKLIVQSTRQDTLVYLDYLQICLLFKFRLKSISQIKTLKKKTRNIEGGDIDVFMLMF